MKMTTALQTLENKSISPVYDSTDRSFKERAFHALLFETVALLICAPLFAFLLDRSVSEMGLITFLIATTAVMWNFVYNLIFDRVTRGFIKERNLFVRVIHAVIFEGGLIVITVPLVAWLFSMTIVDVFFMEIGILLFFLPYTVIFNWIYDATRKALWNRRQRA